mmetsp:Transcript_18342/g.51022  ORF Transcript_18342/g.51022 Transcript_18342/m.51022 type:complete len:207 (+) Transcript_18342:891-1511(+)
MRPVRPQPAASKAATTTDRPASAARCRGESLLSSRESPWYGIAKSCALGRRSLRSISMSPCMTATWSGVRPRASRAWCRACHSANPAEEAAAMSACTASGCAAGLWRALSSFWPFSMETKLANCLETSAVLPATTSSITMGRLACVVCLAWLRSRILTIAFTGVSVGTRHHTGEDSLEMIALVSVLRLSGGKRSAADLRGPFQHWT